MLKTVIKKREEPRHPVDIEADMLMERIKKWGERYNGYELNPEFQRGHVWTKLDQQKYIEALMRGVLPRQAKTITLNICGWLCNALLQSKHLKIKKSRFSVVLILMIWQIQVLP